MSKTFVIITSIILLISVIAVVFYFTQDDKDKDGMDDTWEIQYGLDPNDSSDALLDNDDDNLSNYQEYVNSTDPTTNDTDSDKLLDYDELVEFHTNPSSNDTDGDGMNDWFELYIGDTEPLVTNGRKAILIEIPLPDDPIGYGLERSKWVFMNKFRIDEQNISTLARPSKIDFRDAIVNLDTTENDIIYIEIQTYSGGQWPYHLNVYDNNDTISFYELDEWLDNVKCKTMIVVLGTSYSGVAGEILSIDNPYPRIIYTSAGNETSSGATFLKYFTESWGVNTLGSAGYIHFDEENADKYGDQNGYVTIKESFEYAKIKFEEKRDRFDLKGYPQQYGDIELGNCTYLGDYEY
ncbi:MAG: hypothetical protein KAS16_07830 [Thermoplasmata archaeon]|nr:hypothetical protein [Thermoplasmata archaeon]